MPAQNRTVIAVDDLRLDDRAGPGRVAVDADGFHVVHTMSPDPGDAGPTAEFAGTLLPAFVDAHVHLELIDPRELVGGGIGGVVDLGSTPQVVRGLAEQADRDPSLPAIVYTGAFLTAIGGYPAGRSWAADASVVQVSSPQDAASAVDRMRSFGASGIKVALNADAGPVLTDDLLRAVVGRAHGLGLPVVAHAQGPGQAARAFAAGVDAFAHAPWSEHLDDALIARMATTMVWTSTLDIHGYGADTAAGRASAANLRRFATAGGRVRYGTDLGNGPLPVGLNPRELTLLVDAGLDVGGLVAALTGPTPPHGRAHRRVTAIPSPAPTDPADAVGWLMGARVLTPDADPESTWKGLLT